MQFWFARTSKISIREQLVTQVVLGILSDDLEPGQRLPSTRELARRFRLHPNTVSAAYRELERARWVESRRGSGVYVRDAKPEISPSSELLLDQLITGLFRSAREMGAPLSLLRSRLGQWLELQAPDHFLLIEPDEELRRIVIAEMERGVTFPVKGCGLQDCPLSEAIESAIPVVLPSKAKLVRDVLPAGAELLTLHIRSVPSSLAEWLPAPPGTLIAVASRWPEFLKLARTMLIAAGFHRDSLMFRDACQAGWQRGLKQSAAVVCDSVTATKLPKGCRAIFFPLLAESSIQELRRYQDFITRPLTSL